MKMEESSEVMGTPKNGPVIAIDGPAGTGKSTTTRLLCKRLGFVHVDTGALYRSIAWVSLKQGLIGEDHTDTLDEEKIIELARSSHLEFQTRPDLDPANRIFINGQDCTSEIRTPEVSQAASQVSSIPGVRAALLGIQRRLGCKGKAILEGRDIGTVIFPDADVKFFLTANLDERAKRRHQELDSDSSISMKEIKKQIEERDSADQSRETAPLKKADDAIEIDTSHLDIDQVISKMELIVREKIKI